MWPKLLTTCLTDPFQTMPAFHAELENPKLLLTDFTAIFLQITH